jgi:hypothetical protein
MTKRLEQAINKLTPEQEEMLAAYAESMSQSSPNVQPGQPMKLDWIGCMKDAPEQSGLEAQEKANQLMIELLLKGMPK